MPLVLDPRVDRRDLRGRLAALRRRGRRLTLARGLALLACLVVGGALAVGLFDRLLSVPSLFRAIALAAILLGTVVVARRSLVVPRRAFDDELALALRVEERFPELNDALASSVQFAEHPSGSAALRRAAERIAVRETEDCDFNDLLADCDAGKPSAAAGCLIVVAASLVAIYPAVSHTALLRLADPFGDHPWPPQTVLTVDAPSWLPRGDPFVLRGLLEGVIPERATFAFALDGAPASEMAVATADGTLNVRLEANRVPRSFRYMVRANDAATKWTHVDVLTPPQLVPLDGRPSPRVSLDFPTYTDLPARDLPDGAGSFECVTGTLVRLRAATDRPIACAWVVLETDPPRSVTMAAVFVLGAGSPLDAAGRFAAGDAVWGRVPAVVSAGGTRFDLNFQPIVPGLYTVRFQDASGLCGHKSYDVRVAPDPSPSVSLERPSAARESLSVLPNGHVTVAATVVDPTFAVRSVSLEYRIGQSVPPGWLLLADAGRTGTALPQLLTPVAVPGVKLRPTAVRVEHRFNLGDVRHPDGRALRDGDVLTLAVIADDFDDVTPWKAPGRSHEVELRVVGPAVFDEQLQKAKADIQRELKEMLDLQRDALRRADAANERRRKDGVVPPVDAEKLLQAEQQQQQLSARVGGKNEGLRGAVGKLQQSLKDNPQPSTAEQNRLDALAAELGRLAEEELRPAEQQLAAARKERDAVPAAARKSGPLPKAVQHQREAERTLVELQEQLKPWSDARELRAEAGMIQRDQERAERQREQFENQPGVRGADPDKLTPEQREELNKLKERQASVGERVADLLNKLGKKFNDRRQGADAKEAEAATKERAATDAEARAEAAKDTPQEANLHREAGELRRQAADAREVAGVERREAAAMAQAREAAEPGLAQQMKEATERLGANKLGEAKAAQQSAAKTLGKVQQALAEPEQKDADRLVKKLADAEKELAELADDQERLQKKAADARQIADPGERQKALEQLTREQEKLQERVRDLAQRLSRIKGDDAGRELRRAGRAMEQAGDQIAQGDNAEDKQDDVLDRLDDAQNEVVRAKKEAEEELQRELRAKMLDALRGLRDRQDALLAETERIFQEVKAAKLWGRATHQKSLFDVADGEKGLGDEVGALSESRFKDAKVIAYLVKQAAESMAAVGEAVESVRDAQWNLDAWDDDRTTVQSPQKSALKRLDQLLDVFKDDPKDRRAAATPRPEGKPSSGGSGAGGEDGIPPLAQLKLLRSLQAEVNDRTAEFDRANPDPANWTPAKKAEIEAIRKAQSDLATLLEAVAPPQHEEPPDDRPKSKDKGGQTEEKP